MPRTTSLALVCALSLACTRGPSTVDANDFELEVRSYNWEIGGWDQISVDASGHGEFVYVRGVQETWPLDPPNAQGETEQVVNVPHWFVVEWDASPEQLRGLQEQIDRRFFGLRDHYENPRIHDGITTTYRVVAHGQTKTVECKNRFPRAVGAIDDYLDEIKPAGAPGPIAGERELGEGELVERGLIPKRPAQ